MNEMEMVRILLTGSVDEPEQEPEPAPVLRPWWYVVTVE